MPRLAVTLVLMLSACGPPQWAGTYSTTGTWDLGGPLFSGRTVGDSAADLFVEQTLSILGVPSFAEADLAKALDTLVRPGLKAVVDPNAPPELSPGGSVYVALAAALASVKPESTLTLAPRTPPKGTETFTAFEYTIGTRQYRLESSELAGQGVLLTAEWNGKELAPDSLQIETHEVELRLGELVKRIATVIIDLVQQNALKDRVIAAVSCDRVVARLITGGGLSFSAAGLNYTVSETQLRRACDQALMLAGERVLGLIKLDSKIEIGGTASYAARQLKSVEPFGGVIAVAPRAIAPRLVVSFTGTRVP